MDKGCAILALNSCFRASREIGETAKMVKAFSSKDEGDQLKSRMTVALAEIGHVTQFIYDMHPDLVEHVDQQVEKYGRLS